MKALPWLARTRLDLAGLLMDRHGRENGEARRQIDRAWTEGTELGLPCVVERAERLAAAH